MANITLTYTGPLAEVEFYVPPAPGADDDLDTEDGWLTCRRGASVSVPAWRAEQLLEQVDNWRRKTKAKAAPAKATKAKAAPAKATKGKATKAANPSDPPPSAAPTITEGDPE